jgi:hypothetical protein
MNITQGIKLMGTRVSGVTLMEGQSHGNHGYIGQVWPYGTGRPIQGVG